MSTVLPFKKEASPASREAKGVKAGPDRILVPDDEYDAQAIYHTIIPFKSTRKIYLKLKIVSCGPYFGGEIWVVFQEYQTRYGARSKFYKAWVIAHGKKPRGRKIKPADLHDKIYRIKTRTVLKDEDGDAYPPELRYSVAKIIGLVQDSHQRPVTNDRIPTSPPPEKGKTKGEVE